MRRLSRVVAISLFAFGAHLAIGCSDDSTGPDKNPAPSPGKHIWSMRFGDYGGQYARDLAVDVAGNVFIAGNFNGTIDFGGGPLTSNGMLWDIYVAKFGPDGSHIWSKSFGDDKHQFVRSIAVDPSGNAIITGAFLGSINFGGGALTSTTPSFEDVFVAKFGPGGSHIWSKKFGDANPQFGTAVAADPWGNIFVTGDFQGSISFGGDPFVSDGGSDIFVAKLTPGGVHRWSKHYGNPYDQYSRAIAADGAGNVFVGGVFIDAIDFGCGTIGYSSGRGICVAKLDSAGVCSWSDGFGASGDQELEEIAVDASGNSIIAGSFDVSVDFGGGTLTSAGNEDIFVAKFGPGGAHLWSKRFGDTNVQNGYGVAADASGNAVITGILYGTADFGGGALTDAGAGDVFIAKFGPGGAHLWSKRFGDEQYQIAFGLGTDASGNVFAAGGFNGAIAFGGDTLTCTTDKDVFVAKLGP